MSETVTVKLPRFVEIRDKKCGVTHRIDLKGANEPNVVRACLYKFGGVLDAHAAESKKADALKKANARINAIRTGAGWSAGGGIRVDATALEFGKRVKAILGAGTDQSARDIAKAVEADRAKALATFGMALAVRAAGRKATKAQADKAAQVIWDKAAAQVAADREAAEGDLADLTDAVNPTE